MIECWTIQLTDRGVIPLQRVSFLIDFYTSGLIDENLYQTIEGYVDQVFSRSVLKEEFYLLHERLDLSDGDSYDQVTFKINGRECTSVGRGARVFKTWIKNYGSSAVRFICGLCGRVTSGL